MMSLQYGLLAIVAIALIAGVSDAGPPKKIMGGLTAQYIEFRFMALIRINEIGACGGAIIHKRHIVTAASCVKDHAFHPGKVVVTTTLRGFYEGERSAVKSIVLHPKYNPTNRFSPHDIAIIRLKENLNIAFVRSIVELPSAPPPTGVNAAVAGWGIMKRYGDWTPNTLMSINSKILSYEECSGLVRIGGGVTQNYQLCTSHQHGQGIYYNDEGGPLVYKKQLIGIASWFDDDCHNCPDVYTNVFYYVPWIREMMARKTLISSRTHVCELPR